MTSYVLPNRSARLVTSQFRRAETLVYAHSSRAEGLSRGRADARYLRNSTQLSLIAGINRPRRIPREPLRDVYRRARGHDRTSVSWHSSRERPRFFARTPSPRSPPPHPSPSFRPRSLRYARWKYLFAIRLGRRQATLSRHGNGKHYSSCFRDTLTENTRVSSTYILSRGREGPRGCHVGLGVAWNLIVQIHAFHRAPSPQHRRYATRTHTRRDAMWAGR